MTEIIAKTTLQKKRMTLAINIQSHVENSKQAKKISLDNLINQILDDLNLYYNQ